MSAIGFNDLVIFRGAVDIDLYHPDYKAIHGVMGVVRKVGHTFYSERYGKNVTMLDVHFPVPCSNGEGGYTFRYVVLDNEVEKTV